VAQDGHGALVTDGGPGTCGMVFRQDLLRIAHLDGPVRVQVSEVARRLRRAADDVQFSLRG
jgi:hypothetical protein